MAGSLNGVALLSGVCSLIASCGVFGEKEMLGHLRDVRKLVMSYNSYSFAPYLNG